jgi:hypothetical protein
MIEELKVLAEKATPGPWHSTLCRCGHPKCRQQILSTQGTVGFDPEDAALIVALVNNLPTILSALEAVPVMKEALEQSEQGWENVVEMGLLPPDHWETANNLFHACSQALAALEGK